MLNVINYDSCFTNYEGRLALMTSIRSGLLNISVRALGLIDDDAHWDRTLEEAAVSESPLKIPQLLFAVTYVSR